MTMTGESEMGCSQNTENLMASQNDESQYERSDSSGDEQVENKLRGVMLDTCIRDTDPALAVDSVLSLAPGEGKRPIDILLDTGCEKKAFPQLFPKGEFGFNYDRTVKLTPKKYFNARILNKDNRFAKNIEYLFFAQFICEHKTSYG